MLLFEVMRSSAVTSTKILRKSLGKKLSGVSGRVDILSLCFSIHEFFSTKMSGPWFSASRFTRYSSYVSSSISLYCIAMWVFASLYELIMFDQRFRVSPVPQNSIVTEGGGGSRLPGSIPKNMRKKDRKSTRLNS